jgi:hypothetical protein
VCERLRQEFPHCPGGEPRPPPIGLTAGGTGSGHVRPTARGRQCH